MMIIIDRNRFEDDTRFVVNFQNTQSNVSQKFCRVHRNRGRMSSPLPPYSLPLQDHSLTTSIPNEGYETDTTRNFVKIRVCDVF